MGGGEGGLEGLGKIVDIVFGWEIDRVQVGMGKGSEEIVGVWGLGRL